MDSIFDILWKLDEVVLKIINIKFSNPIFDFLIPIFDKPVGFILPVLFFWIYFIYNNPTKRKQLIILIPILISFTDQIGYNIKKLELKDRPWVIHQDLNHLGGKGGMHHSFPSNHASNSMALATIFVHIIGKNYWGLFILAFISGFSRIYIGVHYPGDVLFGFILGWIVARIIILTTNTIKSNWVKYRLAS